MLRPTVKLGLKALLSIALWFSAPATSGAQTVLAPVAAPEPVQVYQGGAWRDDVRRAFYVQDQGSQMMPLSWLKALRQPDGQPFLADSLARYGYLPNPDSRDNLPVGFTFAGSPGGEIAGMTCAACHTRQIVVAGKPYRIDGGPAIVDFQSLLADIDVAFGAVLAGNTAFQPFAVAVLGNAAQDPDAVQNLSIEVQTWYYGYHTLMMRALPAKAWGPSRLDAVGMIFNRLTGLDIGRPPNLVIADNIRTADAPTRYPFLWNAPIQDHTQWPGFAANGNDILALSRNVGEVLGVFATFEPTPNPWHIFLRYDYLSGNSANFNGLRQLEDYVKKIGPPSWPWSLDMTLVRQGAAIFARDHAQGGCKGCHWPTPGNSWPFEAPTWATPIQDVGTDSREHGILQWRVKTGVLEGARIPIVLDTPLAKDNECAVSVLAVSVAGSIIQSYQRFLGASAAPMGTQQGAGLAATALPSKLRPLQLAFPKADPTSCTPTVAPGTFPYESRVLQGIWAAAPYLHNGSVATLADLLNKPQNRKPSFKIGPNYDIDAVGLAADQTMFDYTLDTTGCEDRNSGNSRCGHDFGTDLSTDEKRALLEYLKSL